MALAFMIIQLKKCKESFIPRNPKEHKKYSTIINNKSLPPQRDFNR
jgi:hypothetical protein